MVAVEWKVVKHMDNNQDHDIFVAPVFIDVEAQKAICAALPYCAGFSSLFHRMKWSVSDLGQQNNTDLYVKVPPPPPLPPSPTLNVWPLPASYTSGTSSLAVDPHKFSIECVGTCPEILTRAIARYTRYVFPVDVPSAPPSTTRITTENHTPSAQAFLSGLDVYVSFQEDSPMDPTEESYQLVIPSTPNGRAFLTSATIVGLLRGLDTFSQLVDVTPEGVYSVSQLPLDIRDSPVYKIRSLMIDSARDFISVPKILEIIEGMSAAKLNVFHWHLTDDQSFPFQSKAFPLLWQKGAFNIAKAVYSYDDVRKVLQHAEERGIRVIPEFDMPAHSQSWINGYPFLKGSCLCPMMDPTLETTYQFLEKFISEIVALFPDPVVHVGGDEVQFSCWNSTEILAFMKANGMKTFAGMYLF